MADYTYQDTLSAKWWTQNQALNFVSSHWDVLEPIIERDDQDSHQDEYVSIRNEMMAAGSVENCGGVEVLANKYSISVDLAELFVDDIKKVITLYKEYLESQ